MPIALLLAILIAISFACVEAGIVPSPMCRLLLRIRAGTVEVEKGTVSNRAKEFVADILRSHGHINGFVTVSNPGKVRFSSNIPPQVRQQIRNILLN